MEKKENNKVIIAAIIISAGLILSSLIFAYSKRYETNGSYRMDLWTKKVEAFDYGPTRGK